jgi:uncharacterized metal-binding protein YceD (DUF177 family)
LQAQKPGEIMMKLKDYDISFKGLKIGEHEYSFTLNDEFFEHFEHEEFSGFNIDVHALMQRRERMLEFLFTYKGSVTVPCDLSNELFDLQLEIKSEWIVKFGHEFNDDDDEILIVPEEEHKVNVAQHLFETVILAIPPKKVHPGIEDGTLESDVLKRLDEMQSKKEKDEIDPRWAKLKDLLDE